MATIAASAEKLAEIKAEDAKHAEETAANASSEPATNDEEVGEGAAEGASKDTQDDDVSMKDESDKDKALRATRQST